VLNYNFYRQQSQSKTHKYIVKHTSELYYAWDFVIMFFQLSSGYYYMFLASYKDAFENHVVILTFELVFVLDFILQFFLTYSNSGNSYQ